MQTVTRGLLAAVVLLGSTQSTAAVQYGEALPKNFPTDTALRRLTFNPYFERMVGEIQQFLGSVGAP